VAGGLHDQPAGRWMAQQRAAYLWWLLETVASVTNWVTEKRLTSGDLETYELLKNLRA